jgi:putative oxidoreductase
LAYDAIANFGVATAGESIATLVACFAGVLLIAGLWTPAVGAVIAIAEAVLAALFHIHSKDAPWSHGLIAVLAVGLAMLGPGAWSIDARLFGRKLLTARNKRGVR